MEVNRKSLLLTHTEKMSSRGYRDRLQAGTLGKYIGDEAKKAWAAIRECEILDG